MPGRKRIQPNEKLPFKLIVAERKLVIKGLPCLDQESEQIVRNAATIQPVMMPLDDLDFFGDYVAAEANHCKDKSTAKKLDAIFERIQDLLDKFKRRIRCAGHELRKAAAPFAVARRYRIAMRKVRSRSHRLGGADAPDDSSRFAFHAGRHHNEADRRPLRCSTAINRNWASRSWLRGW